MTPFIPVDADVRERIRTALGENLCVEAGAGTGKTTVLVDRAVAVLREGAASVDRIAVITFTEAAAAELAGRIRQGLEAALATAPDPVQEARIRDALGGLHRARIETIHAFAAGMLRERPVEAGLDPGFEVLDDLAAQIAYDAAYGEWLRETLSSSAAAIERAVRRGFDLKEIRKLADTVHQYRSLLPLAREHAPAGGASGLVSSMARAAEECRALLPFAGSDVTGPEDMEAIIAFSEALSSAEGDEGEIERQILRNAPRMHPTAGRQSDWDTPQACKDSKGVRAGVKAAIETAQKALRTEAIVDVLPLVEGFVAGYEAQRRSDGVADFDDLLEWTRDMLASSREARDYFRVRFPVILVDEFQDTDPVQADIVVCIASDDEPGDDWLTMAPRPGALTVVGDPKQSIYRFRRADIAIYDAVRRGPLAGGDARLVQSFRSVGGVLDWVNTVFDRVLVEREGVQPANTPLVVGDAALADGSRSVVVVHRVAGGTRADEIRTEEARLLATQIRKAIDSGWTVRAPATGGERPAGYGDVAVLLPRRTALDIYLDAFRRAGVPVRAEGGRSFFQRQEVRDLANLLLAIDDPLDRISLVACLRSTVFGCSDEEIFLHAAGGNRLDLRAPVADGGPASVAEAMGILRDLHDLRSRVSLGQLVRAVLERTRLVELALAGWDGQQSAANLVKLADRARAFSASGAGGLRAFARWLTEQRSSSDEAEASIAEETDDVVRVMTIHASKGLEFPIVAFANLHARSRHDVEPVPDRRAHRLHVRVRVDDRVEFTTPGFASAWAGEEEQRRAEEKRLLYVAATRARDHLIVPVPCAADRAGPMLQDLLPSVPALDGNAGTVVDGCLVVDGAGLPDLPDSDPPLRTDASATAVEEALAERDEWATARREIAHGAREQLEVHPATQDEGDAPVPASLAGADDQPLIAGGDTAPPRRKGEAMHRALELIDLRDPANVAETVRGACILAGIEDATGEVIEMVEACLASPVVARARAADEIWTEVPYTVRVDDGYATGRIDLVVREGDNLVVVDWKSDAIGPSQVAAATEGHRSQGEAYVRFLTATTDWPVREVVFVYPRAGAEGKVACDDSRGSRDVRV